MKFSIIRITAFYIIILSSLAVNSVLAYVSQTRIIHGYVAARGYPTLEVKDKEDELRYIPKICKYDDKGKATMMSYESDDVIIMSAEDFQVYLDKYAELLKKWGKDHLVVEDAETETFKNLKSDTLYVVYLNAQNNENPVLLMESPVCLEDSSSLADYKSLLVDKDSGRILQKEKNDNFGYCSAYYLDKDTNEFAEQGGITNLGGFREGDHFLVNPIENAVIKSGLVSSGSNSNGKYTIFYTMPSCFGFEVSFRNFVAAHVVYQVFNPKNAYHPKTYVDYKQYWDYCYQPNHVGGMGLGALQQASTMQYNSPMPPIKINFTIDFIPISGRISMRNRSITEVVLDDGQIVNFDDKTFTDTAMSSYSYTSDIYISDKTEYSCDELFELKKDTPINGSIGIYPSSKYYIKNSYAAVSAIPDSGYQFKKWTDDASGTNPVQAILMDRDKTVGAEFEEIKDDKSSESSDVIEDGYRHKAGHLAISRLYYTSFFRFSWKR